MLFWMNYVTLYEQWSKANREIYNICIIYINIYNCRKCKIVNLGTKPQDFFYQLGVWQLQISLKQKPVRVRLFTKGETNVTPDTHCFWDRKVLKL